MQLITNHEELHVYAAGKVVEGLRRGASGDALLGAAAYLLGTRTHARLLAAPHSVVLLMYRLHCKSDDESHAAEPIDNSWEHEV